MLRFRFIKRKLRGGRDSNWAGLLFTLPFLIGFVFIFAGLLINSLRFSFSSMGLDDKGYVLDFVGWDNFYHALRVDADYIRIVWTSVLDMLTSLPVIIIFSLFIAVILNRAIPGRTVFRAIFFLPVILTVGMISNLDMNNAVMSAMGSTAMDTGAEASGNAITSIGDITEFLQNLQFSPGIVSFVSGMANNVIGIINQSGVQILISLAALQSIPNSLFEAASVEGATAWETFWKITLPMVSPMLIVNVFYTIIARLTVDSDPLSRYIHGVAFTGGEYGRAAAMSWMFILVVAAMMTVIVLILNRLTVKELR